MIREFADYTEKINIVNKSLIEEYRMKLWCEMFIAYKKDSHARSLAASYAAEDLEMFDQQFNQ